MSIIIILRQPIAISVTVSLILIKLTNDPFIFYIHKIKRPLAKQMMRFEQKYFNKLEITAGHMTFAVLHLVTSFVNNMPKLSL